jgi:hypothetical protein
MEDLGDLPGDDIFSGLLRDPVGPLAMTETLSRHCEEQRDEAIQFFVENFSIP